MSGCPSGKSVILDTSIIKINICLSYKYTVSRMICFVRDIVQQKKTLNNILDLKTVSVF